jgi:hypothetical protein
MIIPSGIHYSHGDKLGTCVKRLTDYGYFLDAAMIARGTKVRGFQTGYYRTSI